MNGLDTVTTTVIEVHQAPNGTIDLNSEQATHLVNGDAPPQPNGIVMEQQQIMQQLPPLFDMDLEKMQAELFKGRYLTPQDFLDDIAKIVHNADVRQYEDPDRLYRAQAMFTATQVSIQEFDPQWRVECERMAAREKQRRDERKRDKEKDKGKDQGLMMATRRSARANGLQPEHGITDPVKLERRLKRQRDGDGNGGDSHTSEGEGNTVPSEDGGRDAKRSRIVDDERDPLDTLQTPGSVNQSHTVRFATQPIEPMAPLIEVSESQDPTSLPFPTHPSLFQNHPNQPQPYSDHMVVDTSPQRVSGFDPTLLNPVEPNPWLPSHYRSNVHQNMPAPSTDPSDPFSSNPLPTELHFGQSHPPPPAQMSFSHILSKSPSPPPIFIRANMKSRSPQPSQHASRQPTPGPSNQVPVLPREPTPMIVERTPTPPLPDFHVSQILVDELRELLRTRTANLTIEQLEQLRATSLGTVWRHRKEWDRDELVRELLRDVQEFVEEVMELDHDED